MCPPPQTGSLPAPKKEQRDPPEDPGSGSYRLIGGSGRRCRGLGGALEGACPHMAMLGKWGDPVSVRERGI